MQEIQTLREELLAREGANDSLLLSLEAAQERMKTIAEDADVLRSEMARAREAEQAAAAEARTAYANALAATQEAAAEAHRLVTASDAVHVAEVGRLTKVIWMKLILPMFDCALGEVTMALPSQCLP